MVATSTAHIPTAGTIHNIAQCLQSPLSHRRLIPLKCDSLNLNIMVMRARAGGGVHLCHANHRLQSHSSAPHCGHPDHGDSDTRGDCLQADWGPGYCIAPAAVLINNSKTRGEIGKSRDKMAKKRADFESAHQGPETPLVTRESTFIAVHRPEYNGSAIFTCFILSTSLYYAWF